MHTSRPDRDVRPAGPESDRLRSVVDDAVADLGLLVEQVRVTGASRTPTLQVSLDRARGTEGVDMEAIEQATGRVSEALDALGDEVPGIGSGEYLLEVSSAGVDRPLTLPRHFARNLGRLVEVAVDGAEPVLARIVSAGQEQVELAVHRPGAKKGMPAKEAAPVAHAYDRLGPAVVQVEWGTRQQDEPESEDAAGTHETTEA